MPVRARVPCLFLVVAFAGAVAAQDSSLSVDVVTAEGRRVAGRLEALADGKVRVSGAAEFKLSDVFRLEWPQQPARLDAESAVLLLANGDRLLVKPAAFTGEALTGTWTWFDAWPEVRVPLEVVRASVFALPSAVAERNRLLDRLTRPTHKADVVLLTNGDVLSGEFQSGDGSNLVLKTAAGASTIARENVVALAMNPELTLVRPLQGEAARVWLVDGSRFQAKNVRLTTDAALSCDTAFGVTLTMPLSAVSSIEVVGGRSIPLSTLEPSEDKSRPYLSLNWPYRKDSSVVGGPLRIRGVEYATGLGVHSHSELSWKLNGEYQTFLATVGVDDSAEGRGSVLFRVMLDGKPAWSSPLLTGKNDPVTVEPIDVSSARVLTLIVEFGTFGDVLDHADWGDARLVK
jgi:hypothetical protein